MLRLSTIGGLLALAACGGGSSEPTVIDGSSPEVFETTLQEAKRDLGPADRVKFEAALAEFRARTFAKADNRKEYDRLVRKGLDGLTAPRVVAQLNRDVGRVKGEAADAAFDAKRAVSEQR